MKEISIREFEGLSIGQAENKAAAYGLPAARDCLKTDRRV